MTDLIRLDDLDSIPAGRPGVERISLDDLEAPMTVAPLLAHEPDPSGRSWSSRSLITLAAALPEPPNIGGLLYAGKRTLLSGELESLKTWLALVLAKAEMDIGYPVIWTDFDAMGAGELLARLRALGVPDAVTHELFLYKEPEERLADPVLSEVCDEVSERGVRLFVCDAFNPMLSVHGLDPNKTADIETFWREVAAPICAAGAAPTLLDHVVKSPEGRGKYAYGSERKASGAIVHIGFRLLHPLTRGGTGRALLTTHKDRPGFLPRPVIGRLVLDSDGEGVAYRLEPELGREDGRFRPTVLMERVSLRLEQQDEAVSQTWIEQNVQGKRDALREALAALVEEGYVGKEPAARGGHGYVSARPYREEDDVMPDLDATPPQPRPDSAPGLVSIPTTTPPPSRATPYGGARGGGVVVDRAPSTPPPLPDDAPEWEKRWHANRAARRAAAPAREVPAPTTGGIPMTEPRPLIGDPGYLPWMFARLERGVITEGEWHQADRAHRFVILNGGAHGD